MQSIVKALVAALLASCLVALGCGSPNEEPQRAAEIVAFTATPGLVAPGDETDLRWRIDDALVVRLYSHVGTTLPDSQPWTCVRDGGEMVCTAPSPPADATGWSCQTAEGTVCRRGIENDPTGYRPIQILPSQLEVGTYSLAPDATTTFRIEAEGNSGAPDLAWVNVGVSDTEETARIISWSAWPSPAVVGDRVLISYETFGCDQIEYDSWPVLAEAPEGEGDWSRRAGYTNERGTLEWYAADVTHDFYLGCHPAGASETARIRSHITVVVEQMPEVCERIDRFTVSPSDEVEAGTEVEITWMVSNAEWVSGEGFASRVGSTEFSGTRHQVITEETTLAIIAHGECGEVREERTISIADGE